MATVNAPILNFSGGILGNFLGGRVDVPAYAKSAEVMENWRPMAQGPMVRRPPMNYVDSFDDHSRRGYMMPFVFNTQQSYVILGDTSGFSFYIRDGRITVPTVTATIADGTFSVANGDLADGAGIVASHTDGGSVSNLVDESTVTTWRGDNLGAPVTLTFDLLTAKNIKDLWLTSGSTSLDADRAPTAFNFFGSATGAFAGEETLVLAQTGLSWGQQERKKFRVTAPASYRYYRIQLVANVNPTDFNRNFTLSEVSMFSGSWLDNSTGSAVVTITSGKLYLDSGGSDNAVAEQVISIIQSDTDHVLSFNVDHGPVSCRVGTTSGASNLLLAEELRTGRHQLSFDPGSASQVYLQFFHSDNAGRVIDNVSFMTAGNFKVVHPYSESELETLQFYQIGDVLYLTSAHHETRRLERRGNRSWSLTYNRTANGPYGPINQTATTLATSDTSGEVTLTASEALFSADDAGQLFALTDSGQLKQASGSVLDVSTDGIKVTGSSGAGRTFNIQVSGTFTGTVTLQESSGNENNYVNTDRDYTAPANQNYDDNKDNETWFYRLIVTDYTSGTITMKLTYNGGSSTGVVRIITVSSPTSATAEVIDPIPSTEPVNQWRRSAWNAVDGWPSSTVGGYGRLFFARGIQLWASVSDDFTNFEEGDEADQAFSKTLAQESSEGVRYLEFIGQLVIGTATREQVGTGNTSAEPVGPSNFETLPASEEGTAQIKPVRSEGSVLFVHRSRRKLMQFTQTPGALSDSSFTSIDLSELAPELLDDEVVRLAIQREPQRRVYAVLRSGRLAELLFRREIEVTAWSLAPTDGRVEDVMVIQQEDKDEVYLVVRRRIAGQFYRFLERMDADEGLEDYERFHLDSALSTPIIEPDTIVTPSGVTGVITLESDDDAFVVGDVGKMVWLAGGRARITNYTNARQVTATVLSKLLSDRTVAPRRWAMVPSVSSVSGLDHLEGATVQIYGDRKDLGTATVSSGSVMLPEPASIVHVGLPFRSKYKSLKLAYGAQKGTAVGMKKSIKQLTFVLEKTGPGLKHGPDFERLTELKIQTTSVLAGEPVPLFSGEINGENFATVTGTDPRLCIVADGAAPASIVGVVPSIQTIDV